MRTVRAHIVENQQITCLSNKLCVGAVVRVDTAASKLNAIAVACSHSHAGPSAKLFAYLSMSLSTRVLYVSDTSR